MAIQWFPGHMNLARKAIAERVKGIDVFIELLDARLPGSSANPMLAQLTEGRPTIKVLNKSDMADSARTAQWQAHYNSHSDTHAFALSANLGVGEKKPIQRLRDACFAMAPLRGGMAKPMRVLIGGVPNVGKSTLINSLVGKKTAKTGDEAGITRHEQRLVLADDFYLYDTPGMLWPRIAVEQSGYNLAASGAVGKNAYDEPEVALELLAYLQKNYPQLVQARYKLAEQDVVSLSDEALLELIARKRQAVAGGGRVDWHKVSELIITDYRTCALGCITLETPEEFAQWRAQADVEDAERLAKQAARKPVKKQKPRLN